MNVGRSRTASALTLACIVAAGAWVFMRSPGPRLIVDLTPAILATALELGWWFVRVRWPDDLSRGTNARSAATMRLWTGLSLVAAQLAVFFHAPPTPGIVNAAVGSVMVTIGNVLPALRRNTRFGLRTPWTLASERSWDLAHRRMGWTLVACGIALVVAGLCFDGASLQPVFSVVAVVVIVAALASSAFTQR